MKYGYSRKVAGSFEAVVGRVEEALQEFGFGILTRIDVKQTLKKKLEVDFDSYIVLGACNPQFGYQALQAEPEIGLLLPCNVIVYEKDGEIIVSAIKPTVAMAMIDNAKLAQIAKEVEKKLADVVDYVSTVKRSERS